MVMEDGIYGFASMTTEGMLVKGDGLKGAFIPTVVAICFCTLIDGAKIEPLHARVLSNVQNFIFMQIDAIKPLPCLALIKKTHLTI